MLALPPRKNLGHVHIYTHATKYHYIFMIHECLILSRGFNAGAPESRAGSSAIPFQRCVRRVVIWWIEATKMRVYNGHIWGYTEKT